MREGSGIAGAIAGLLVVGFALLPALLVLAGSLFLFGYALLRTATGGGMSAHAVVVGTVLIGAAFPLLLALGAGLLGRALAPPRRQDG
jgi:predicted anti-sigma-YlaC factor YlaD